MSSRTTRVRYYQSSKVDCQFVDLVRGALGLDPLYSALPARTYYRPAEFDQAGFDSDGNRRVGFDRGALRTWKF